MFGLSRRKRPVDWGPYPLEGLRRDEAVIAQESHRPALECLPKIDAPNNSLNRSSKKYRDLFATLRQGPVFKKPAPVPNSPARRAQDLKGAGYFLDASQMGICVIPDNAWLGETGPVAGHTHAIVVLVEYANPIDADNIAADWVAGSEHDLASTRAAEISTILSGDITAMGFDARSHWNGQSEVDLDRLAVLAGLGIRDDDGIFNPFVGNQFALGVVTTTYTAQEDLPLHTSARNGKGLKYLLGYNGAVSGLERWRRSRRKSHLGPYPVEALKRQDRPTTHIFEDEVPRVPQSANFYNRAERGDMGDKALAQRPRWSYKHPIAQGILNLLWGMVPYQEGVSDDDAPPLESDAENNAKGIKALAHYLGASSVGICEIPDYCWYSHRKDGSPIKPYHKYAVMMLIDQGHETFEGGCGDDWISGSQSMRSYMRGAEVSGTISEHIRQLGFPARAQTSLDSDVLHVPLVILSGQGELSRIGETAINPFLGPRIKTVVLTTDMPLAVDKPIDFGLQQFCGTCKKCARECPSQAIPFGDKIIFNGYETWKPDSERCTRYRMMNMKGSACGRCIKVCPLTKDVTWDGPLYARIGSWLGIHALWLKPILVPIAIWLDDKMGNGNPVDEKKWWLDLEVVGEKCHQTDPENFCQAPDHANRKTINGKRQYDGSNQRIAVYPADVIPPPKPDGPTPPDRKAGIDWMARAESVEQALRRREAQTK